MKKNQVFTLPDLRAQIKESIVGLVESGQYRSLRQVAIASGVAYSNLHNAMKDAVESDRFHSILVTVAQVLLGVEIEPCARIVSRKKSSSSQKISSRTP